MKVGLFTQFNDNFREVSDITVPVMEAYCHHHGYRFHGIQNPECSPHGIIWNRIRVLLDNLGDFDWVAHVDADVLITNKEVKLEDFFTDTSHVVVSADTNGVNDGVMFVRNSIESRMLLLLLWNMRSAENVFCAQDALRDVLRDYPSLRSWVHVAPQSRFNAYNYPEYGLSEETVGQWKPGDFALHMPGCSNQRRAEVFTQALKTI